jgi:hypothetical protein
LTYHKFDNFPKIDGQQKVTGYSIIYHDIADRKNVESICEAIEKVGIEHKWSEVADVVTVSVGHLSVTPGIGITVDKI